VSLKFPSCAFLIITCHESNSFGGGIAGKHVVIATFHRDLVYNVPQVFEVKTSLALVK
jgi:hypothetical protein